MKWNELNDFRSLRFGKWHRLDDYCGHDCSSAATDDCTLHNLAGLTFKSSLLRRRAFLTSRCSAPLRLPLRFCFRKHISLASGGAHRFVMDEADGWKSYSIHDSGIVITVRLVILLALLFSMVMS